MCQISCQPSSFEEHQDEDDAGDREVQGQMGAHLGRAEGDINALGAEAECDRVEAEALRLDARWHQPSWNDSESGDYITLPSWNDKEKDVITDTVHTSDEAGVMIMHVHVRGASDMFSSRLHAASS
jgi:hypothetical protein